MDVHAEKLIYLIEARRPIYNYKDKDHPHKIIIEKLWVEVATEMKLLECKNKWASLRNSYSRQLRDERSKPSGSHGKQKKKWYLADAMSFLKDYINQHRSTGSSLCSPDVEENADEISLVDSPISLSETQSTTSTAKNRPVSCKRSKVLMSEMLAGPMIEFLQSRTRDKPQDDANALFFKSMLADYQKLSSKRQRAFRVQMINTMNIMHHQQNHAGQQHEFRSYSNSNYENWPN